jgi:parallel beta-helix repeat protein
MKKISHLLGVPVFFLLSLLLCFVFFSQSASALDGKTRGELNSDGEINILDLSSLLAHWGANDQPQVDVNNDGAITIIDLSIMLSNWGMNTYYVSLSGDDGNSGMTEAQAFASFDQAASVVSPGDIIRFVAGTYVRSDPDDAALIIDGMNGTPGGEITITTVEGDEQQAVFTVNNFNFYTGIRIHNSSYLVIDNLTANESDAGIQVTSSDNITLQNNLVHDTGQLGIAARAPVTWNMGSCTLSGTSSSNITIQNNTIYTTGKKNNGFGEGVYVGQGCTTGDSTHDVLIAYNDISATGGEAVDVKQDTYNVTVEYNTIYNIVVYSQGAITLGAAVHNYPNGNYIVRYNDINGVTTSNVDGAAIWVGHGDTLIDNNTINNVSDYHGIFLASDFGNTAADDVTVTNNVLINITGGSAITTGEGLSGGSAGTYDIRDNTF